MYKNLNLESTENIRAPRQSVSELLESSRLLMNSSSRKSPTASVQLKPLGAPSTQGSFCCCVCQEALDPESNFPQAVRVCQKCLSNYALVDSILNDHADNKISEFRGRIKS